MTRTRISAAALLALSVALTKPAAAALTDSEKAVVKTFIKKGALETASRVRALVARPDLSPEEIAAPLKAGFAEAPFDDAHARFTDALLFGQGSAASRNSLVPAVVEGLLARAASRMSGVPMDPSAHAGPREEAAVAEIVAIHAFVDEKIANAGRPPPDGHDGSMAIRDDALSAAAKRYLDHVNAHERWVRAPGAVSNELARVRTQLSLAFIDLARGVLGRHEVAVALGLEGARAGIFERKSVLVEADGAPDARVAEAVRLLEGVPHATDGLSAFLLSKESPLGLVARGKVMRAGAVLTEQPRPIDQNTLWGDEVTPSAPDRGLSGIAAGIALSATTRALAQDPALAERARVAGQHAARAGAVGYLAKSVTAMPLSPALGGPTEPPAGALVVAEALRLLLLDAGRAAELAAIRERAGRPEPVEQLALAFTVLVSDAATASAGHTKDDGTVETVPVTDVKRDGSLVSEVKLGNRRVTIASDKDAVFTIAFDGDRPKLTSLASFHEVPVEGESWDSSGNQIARLFGAPRAVALDDGRFIVEGSPGGFDALSSGALGGDAQISAILKVRGAGGGLLARAKPGASSYEGVALLLEPAESQIQLLVMDGHGKGHPLADPAKLPPPPPAGYAASLEIKGDKVVAKVGTVTLSAKLGNGPTDGRSGLAARAGARLEVQKLVVKTSP